MEVQIEKSNYNLTNLYDMTRYYAIKKLQGFIMNNKLTIISVRN